MHFPHPLADTWQCGACNAELTEAECCPECHAVLCGKCGAGCHTVPAGARAGQRCGQPERPTFEDMAAVASELDLHHVAVPFEQRLPGSE